VTDHPHSHRKAKEPTGKNAGTASTRETTPHMYTSSDLFSNLTAVHQAALDWYVRRNGPDWTLDDEQTFTTWLSSDTLHRDAFAGWQQHDKSLSTIPPEAIAHLKGRLAIDKARLGARQELPAKPSVESLPHKPAHARLAATVLASTVAVLGLVWHHQYASPVFSQSYATAKGELMEIQLPDGSRLQLDTASKIEVVYYRKQREVLLKGGQAMFSVSPDKSRPFLVTAGDTRVSVLGTRFSVRFTPEQQGRDRVQVAVEEGRVGVIRKPQGPNSWLPANYYMPVGAEMTQGQQLIVQADGAQGPIRSIDTEAIAPWREHRLTFVNTPLGEAIDELNRYTDSGLVIRDPQVAAQRISGTFDSRNVAVLKQILPNAIPVRLISRGDVTEIVGTR
jgi:transmembrane sensor